MSCQGKTGQGHIDREKFLVVQGDWEINAFTGSLTATYTGRLDSPGNGGGLNGLQFPNFQTGGMKSPLNKGEIYSAAFSYLANCTTACNLTQ